MGETRENPMLPGSQWWQPESYEYIDANVISVAESYSKKF